LQPGQISIGFAAFLFTVELHTRNGSFDQASTLEPSGRPGEREQGAACDQRGALACKRNASAPSPACCDAPAERGQRECWKDHVSRPRRNPRCPPSWAVVVESSSGQMAHRLSPTTARPQGNNCEPRERANSWPQGARRCKRHCSAAWNAACKGIVSLRSAWILRCVASRYSAAWSRGLRVISGILGFGAPARSITRRAGGVAPLAIANMGMLPAKCLKAILLWRDIPFDDSKNWTDFTLRVVDTPRGERDLVP
jgi:hypothetical protein